MMQGLIAAQKKKVQKGLNLQLQQDNLLKIEETENKNENSEVQSDRSAQNSM